MARKFGQTAEGSTKGKAPSATPKPDDNSKLTDDDSKALFFQHRGFYARDLEAKKKADAKLRDTCKKAKAELGPYALMQIKFAIELEGDDAGEAARERIEAQIVAARWMGLPIGQQGSLFEADRRPAEEIAALEGYRAGAAGESRKVPEKYGQSSPAGQAWLKAWSEGQEAIFNIKQKIDGPSLIKAQNVQPAETEADVGSTPVH